MNWNKKTRCNKLYMAGGFFSGLTSQTLCPFSCGSDRIFLRNPQRQLASDRYGSFKFKIQLKMIFDLSLI